MRVFLLCALPFAIAVSAAAQEQPAQAPPQQQEQSIPQFSKKQLEQLVAPIALYPDDLLAQVLAAATYPVDIVEAARWVKRNPSLDQDGLNTELKAKKWDPSVKGVVFFPDLLARMSDNMDWTKDLGDAFLTQQKDVMDSIQVMRQKAIASGALKSDENQKVTTTEQGQTVIQPTNPETVYVQNYVPSESYGSDWNDNYNDDYWGYSGICTTPAWPWRGYGAAWALGFRCGWNRGNLEYGNNYYNGNFYRNNLAGRNVDPQKREWANDRANARLSSAGTQQAAVKAAAERRTAQNFEGGKSAASAELRQNIQEGDRAQAAKSALQSSERLQTAKAEAAAGNLRQAAPAPEGSRAEAAKSALQNADRSQVAAKLQSADRSQVAANLQNQNRAQAAKTVAQARPQQKAQPTMNVSRNANAERAYSNRGAQSRNVSAQVNNRGGAAVKSKAGSAPKARPSAAAKPAAGGRR